MVIPPPFWAVIGISNKRCLHVWCVCLPVCSFVCKGEQKQRVESKLYTALVQPFTSIPNLVKPSGNQRKPSIRPTETKIFKKR